MNQSARMTMTMRVLVIILSLASITAAHADSGDLWKITNDRRQFVGDVYDPGHGRRLQLRDDRGKIVGYIEKDGTLTDTRRRKIGDIEDAEKLLEEK